MTTRRTFVLSGLGTVAATAIGMGSRTYAAPALEQVKIVIPASSVFVLSYFGAKDAGIFRKHGIDLQIDARPFAGFLAGLPSKQCMVTTYAGLDAIQKINEGIDWVLIGPGLTIVQDILVLKNSPIKTPKDLRGKTFGTFSTGASSFKSVGAALMDAYNFNLNKETKIKQVAGPALTKLLERGEIDAMMNISSLNLAAEAQTNKFRVLFSPNEYWIKKTGYPIAMAGPIVAWRSWVNEDVKRAKNLATAITESFEWLEKPENLETAAKKYGKLAGVTKPEDVAEYKEWLQHKHMFMTSWDRKSVDAQWKFLELAKRVGVIKEVPAKDKSALFVGELGT